MKRILKYCIFLIALGACRKDKVLRDESIHGNIRNNCTGKGFANVEVLLTITKEKSFGKTESSTNSVRSDENGNFSFDHLTINKSNGDKYFISIPGKVTADYEFYGIGSTELDKDQITEFLQIGTSASFKHCEFYTPNKITVHSPDTFTFKLEQRTLHAYEPNRIWESVAYPKSFINGYSNFANYPMGWWYITFNKTKNAITTVITDSIYLDMGATASYTLPW